MNTTPKPKPAPIPAPADWARIREVFEAALPLDAAGRAALLAGPTLSATVLAEVLSLLEHEARAATGVAAGFLSAPATADMPEEPEEPGREGQQLGPWRIVRRLGAGGMGDVWLAERADGLYAGQAAVKVLKRGMDSAAVLARFALEQQALARLSHPHIGHLLDAGRTEDGLPYFVMEHVQGVAIDRACEGAALETRLALFLQLADAVAHAHRNLLVHRDLKPSNVLVTADQNVKLLDFGIAKALDPGTDQNQAADTQQGRSPSTPYTPHYASPEQVRGQPVTTATDIYSLGVLLYVMLTGLRPYGRNATTPAEAARSVLEEEPTRPSALSPGLVADPLWLATRKRLRGDLDNILLKALDKTVERRYVSVDALAADVRAFLSGHPVSAQPASTGYLLRKFVARNRVAVGAATLAAVALLGGLGASTWQWQRAEREKAVAQRRFEQVRVLANRLLFDYHDEIHLLPGSTAVRARMLKDAREHLQSLAAEVSATSSSTPQPALQRELGVAHRRLAELYHAEARPALGDVQTSLQLIHQAQKLLQQAADAAPLDDESRYQLALVHGAQASSLRSAGDPRAALGHLQVAQGLFDSLATAHPRKVSYRIEQVRSQLRLAEVYGGGGSAELAERDKAAAHQQQAYALVQAVYREWPDDTDAVALVATVLNLRWLGEFNQGRVEEGLATLRSLSPVFERLLQMAPDNTLHRRDAAVNHLSQGTALMRLQRWPEALLASSEGLRRMQAVAATDPANRVTQRDVAKLQSDVAWSQFKLGRQAEAAAGLATAVASFEALAKHDPKDRRVARTLAVAHAQRAEVMAASQQPTEVARHTDRALAVAEQLRAATPGDTTGQVLLATVQTQAGNAWAVLGSRSSGAGGAGGPTAARACASYRAALQGWLALESAGKLRPADRPRLEDARSGVARCSKA